MKEVIDGIVTALTANAAFKTAVSYVDADDPGFYFGRAPDGVIANRSEYVVIHLIANMHGETFADYLEDMLIQFTMRSNRSSTTGDGGGVSIEDLRIALWNALDEVTLTIDGYSQALMLRQNTVGPE